jgi:hypothetical protein
MPTSRPGEDDTMTDNRIEAVADNTLAKKLTQWVMPAMLGVLGGLLMQANNRIEATQARQGVDISQIKSDVRDVNTRLDAQVIRQADSNTKQIDKLGDRVSTLERAVHTP